MGDDLEPFSKYKSKLIKDGYDLVLIDQRNINRYHKAALSLNLARDARKGLRNEAECLIP